MKFSRLSILLGAATTAAVSIAAFPSSAYALTWTLNNVIFSDGAVATGSFDYNAGTDIYSNINVTLSLGNPTLYTNRNFTALDFSNSSTPDTLRLCNPASTNCINSQFIRLSALTDLIDTPGTTILLTGSTRYGTIGNPQTVTAFNSLQLANGGNISTPVPFNIPGGATIPAVGGLLALGLMRKARKSLASNTRISKPISEGVS